MGRANQVDTPHYFIPDDVAQTGKRSFLLCDNLSGQTSFHVFLYEIYGAFYTQHR